MAYGIKSINGIEQGDILMANGYMDVYDYDSELEVEKRLIPYDTAFAGDVLGYYYKSFNEDGGKSLISFLTPDAINTDGSPAFKSRIYYFVLKSETYSFKANPKYNYPSSSLITVIDQKLLKNNEFSKNEVKKNGRNIFLTVAAVLVVVVFYLKNKGKK